MGLQVTTLLRRLTRVARPPAPAPVPPGPAAARGRLPAGQAGAQGLLDRLDGEARQGYLRQAVAAGHGSSTLERFAERLRGRPEPELRRRLRLVDLARPGPVTVGGIRFKQTDGTTCGPMTILAARTVVDPVYAWWLTGGGPDELTGRLDSEQRRIHRAANLAWPRRYGTTPHGVASALGRHRPGVRYRWRMVDDTDRRSIERAVADARAAVRAGHPVAVLIGAVVPRHWVLLLRDGDELTFYNPAPGSVVRIGAGELLAGRADPLGFPHVQAVVLPTG
jgi:hypothetical protein